MAGDVKETTDSNFDGDILKASGTVLVDFWAPWCGPCKSIAPVLEEIAVEFKGKLDVFKLNVDDNNASPGKYGVRGIPCLIFFKGGEVVGRVVGYKDKKELVEEINKII